MLQLKTPWFWGGFSSSAIATFLIPELFALSQDECRVTSQVCSVDGPGELFGMGVYWLTMVNQYLYGSLWMI